VFLLGFCTVIYRTWWFRHRSTFSCADAAKEMRIRTWEVAM
jgi:hypothetical protein